MIILTYKASKLVLEVCVKYNRKWMAGAAKADSKWEGKLRDTLLSECDYHGGKIPYFVEHTYEPDFTSGNIIIEAKGRFRERSEATKYIWVRNSLEGSGRELVFLFYNPYTAFPHAKVRKNGTKMTHAEWADKNGFRWFTEQTIKEIL